jgi:hypothetical protein
MTHSAKSERFGLYGCSIFLHGFKTMPIHNTADGNMTRSWIQLLSTVGMRVKKEKFDHRAVFLSKRSDLANLRSSKSPAELETDQHTEFKQYVEPVFVNV